MATALAPVFEIPDLLDAFTSGYSLLVVKLNTTEHLIDISIDSRLWCVGVSEG